MPNDGGLKKFERTLKDLLSWFKAAKTRGVVIGGIAVGLIGRPRLTEDVDALVFLEEEQWDSFINIGSQFGFRPRISDPLIFADKNRVLLMHHRPSGYAVDISFGVLPFEEEAIKRCTRIRLGSVALPIPTPEDLVIMKAIAHRPKDWEDIRTILDAHPRLDLRRINRWVKQFAEILENSEIFLDLKKIIGEKAKEEKRRKT